MTMSSRVPVVPMVLASLVALVLAASGCSRPAEHEPAKEIASPAPQTAPQTAPAPAQAASPAPVEVPATLPPAVHHTPKPAERPAPKVAASAEPKPQPNPEPPPAPKPEPVVKTVAAGTDLDVELLDGASSGASHVGDPVRARVTKAIVVDGLTVVPAGATINGTVTEAIASKTIGGAASLGLRFDTLDLAGGAKAPIATGIHEQGKDETGRDAGAIAGATAGGALLGRLLSKGSKTKGTLIGAVVGAAVGTGAAAATKGQEVELPAGTPLALHLEQPLEITVLR